MHLLLSVLVSAVAILTHYLLYAYAGFAKDWSSTQSYLLWTGTPYLAYCGLTSARARTGDAGPVFVTTALSAGLATFAYAADMMPYIHARSRGEELMNCAGPLVQLGVPILQWVLVGWLGFATEPRSLKPGDLQQTPDDGRDLAS
jgi:hypothetical protein